MVFALEGIKIMETASAIAGPMAGRLLANWGADVVHIEHAERGDIARSAKGGIDSRGKMIESDIDYIMQNLNRNKRGMTLNPSKESGREIMYKLIETSDVFLSNFRPYELTKFGLEYKTLKTINPRLVYANVNGFGQKGPDKDLPGFEQTGFFARSGMLHTLQVPGASPPYIATGSGDNVASLCLALGIVTALFSREKTGRGQKVETSLFHAGIFTNATDLAGSLVTGKDRTMLERQDYANALLNLFETKDGRWLQLAIVTPDLYWSKLCRSTGHEALENDPRFETFEPRIENHVELFHILEETFRTKTLAEWKAPLTEAGLIWAPVSTLPEVTADPQARANDFFAPIDHPTYGRIEVVSNPVHLSETPAVEKMPSPEFGQHTEEVLLEHGFTWEDIQRFKESEAIA